MSENNKNEIILTEVEDSFSISVPVQESHGSALSYGYYFRMGMPDPNVEDKLSLPKTGDLGKEINKFILTPDDKEGTESYTEKFGALLYALDKVNIVSPKINMSAMNVATKASRNLQYTFLNDKKKNRVSSIKYSTPGLDFRWSFGADVKMEAGASKSFALSASSSTKLNTSLSLSAAMGFAWNLAGKLNYSWGSNLKKVPGESDSQSGISKYFSFTTASKDNWFLKTGKDARELSENKTIISEKSIKLIVDKFEPNIVEDAIIFRYANTLTTILASCTSILEFVVYTSLPVSVNITSGSNARSQSANSSTERAGAYAKKADEEATKAEKNGDSNAEALRIKANEKKSYANAKKAEEKATKYKNKMNKSEDDVKRVEDELKKLEEAEKKAEEESKSQDIKEQIALEKFNAAGGRSYTPEAWDKDKQRQKADLKRSELISARNKVKEKKEELNRKKDALRENRDNYDKAKENAESLKEKGYNEQKEKEYDLANKKEYYALKEKEKEDFNFSAIELSAAASVLQATCLAVLAICSTLQQSFRDKKYSDHRKKLDEAASKAQPTTGIVINEDKIEIINGKSKIEVKENKIVISVGSSLMTLDDKGIHIQGSKYTCSATEVITISSDNMINMTSDKNINISSTSVKVAETGKKAEKIDLEKSASAGQTIADVAEEASGSMDQLTSSSNEATSGAAKLQPPSGV